MRLLSQQFERLEGRPLLRDEKTADAPVIRRGRKAKAKGRRGPRGSKTAKLAALGGKIYAAVSKDKGTKFTTARLQSIVGNGAAIGPSVRAWNKANPEKMIAATGPGRAREYAVK
jgi:hypothetical protein